MLPRSTLAFASASMVRMMVRLPSGVRMSAGSALLNMRTSRLLAAPGKPPRCAGVTGFLQVGALCAPQVLPLSAHCGPSLHAPVCCAVAPVCHIEYFHDHVRIEHLLFDGVLTPIDGCLHPDFSRPGCGFDLRQADAAPYAV